jgi:ketol-acid reductoisomerase
MRYSVSDTAEYGDYSRGPRVISEDVRTEMRKVLAEIRDGSFAREWITEWREGAEKFRSMRKKDHDHQIEQVGAELRSMMGWLEKPKGEGAY